MTHDIIKTSSDTSGFYSDVQRDTGATEKRNGWLLNKIRGEHINFLGLP
jgi:hypothetical protein